jgi:hypothetical protein
MSDGKNLQEIVGLYGLDAVSIDLIEGAVRVIGIVSPRLTVL